MTDYEKNDDKLNKICHDKGWPEDWVDQVRELLKLNNGCIDSFILRAHFAISWAACKRLSDSLIEAGCAKPLSKK